MAQLRIERVNALPDPLTASTLYIVKNADAQLADVYFTGTDVAEVRHIISKADVTAMIASAVGNMQNIQVVADIAARDALVLDRTTLVLVLDATADETVEAGSAMYVWDVATTQYFKVAEYESLDIELTWDSIAGRPTSTPAAIDDAVMKAHTHSNKASLDKIGEDGNGQMTYNGQPVSNYLAVADW